MKGDRIRTVAVLAALAGALWVFYPSKPKPPDPAQAARDEMARQAALATENQTRETCAQALTASGYFRLHGGRVLVSPAFYALPLEAKEAVLAGCSYGGNAMMFDIYDGQTGAKVGRWDGASFTIR
ncbi:MAG TPA: hypothetical protein VFG53_00095 [Anaeromyxobacter sp.]|nr:hypothetical protein [Anaeromyxobacter sp.]